LTLVSVSFKVFWVGIWGGKITYHSSFVGCKTVANMIKGKSVEEIRKQFNIVNDFTPEEEEQIRKVCGGY